MGDLTRREFLAVAAATSLFPRTSHAQEKTTLKSCFDGVKLTDQYGQEIKPATLLGNGQALFIFGYNNCALCEGNDKSAGVVDVVAAMQQELWSKGKHIPIVLVDVIPETDKFDAKAHVASHYAHGVRQFKNEKVLATEQAGEIAFDAGAKKEQKNRLFHIVYAPTNQWVEELQTIKMGLVQDPKNNFNHALDVVLFDGGAQKKTMLALPLNGKTLADFKTRGKTLAGDIISELSKVR
jgi:cytochrome oxidase Cu insertion factor (SCO1/SenC/PrrC family)